jgi:hypothetical protein
MMRNAVSCYGEQEEIASFIVGARVSVRLVDTLWAKATIRQTPNEENDYAFVVECDEKWHDNVDFYSGRGGYIYVRNDGPMALANAIQLRSV